MVAFKFSTISAAIIGLASLTFVTALPSEPIGRDIEPGADRSLIRRQADWDSYHKLNADFRRDGYCRVYLGPTSRPDPDWSCREHCHDKNGPESGYNCNLGVPMKDVPAYLIRLNPNGEKWAQALCECFNTDFVEQTVEQIAQALNDSLVPMCGLYMEAAKVAVELASNAVPGGKPVLASIKQIIRFVKMAAKTKDGKDGWIKLVHRVCGTIDWDKSEAWDKLSNAPGGPDDCQ